MPHIQQIHIQNHFKLPDLSIDLSSPDEPLQHLILTGPNGSGKTTILNALMEDIDAQLRPRTVARLERLRARPSWSSHRGPLHLPVFAQLRSGRALEVPPLQATPTIFQPVPGFHPQRQGPRLLEYLVYLHIQARLAEFDDKGAAAQSFSWLRALDEHLAWLLDIPGLKTRFERKTYDLTFVEPGGAEYSFQHLSAGHAAVLDMLGELIVRIDANGIPREDAEGVVVIDEIDMHLHLELQEKILPFLTGTFPKLQFIVATHSPAIISSVDNAVVFDLETLEHSRSADYQGTPYGQLMTGHFGLETDIDRRSTEGLRRLKALRDTPDRTVEETDEMHQLAERLIKTSQPLALEIYNQRLMETLRTGSK